MFSVLSLPFPHSSHPTHTLPLTLARLISCPPPLFSPSKSHVSWLLLNVAPPLFLLLYTATNTALSQQRGGGEVASAFAWETARPSAQPATKPSVSTDLYRGEAMPSGAGKRRGSAAPISVNDLYRGGNEPATPRRKPPPAASEQGGASGARAAPGIWEDSRGPAASASRQRGAASTDSAQPAPPWVHSSRAGTEAADNIRLSRAPHPERLKTTDPWGADVQAPMAGRRRGPPPGGGGGGEGSGGLFGN